MRIFKHHKTLKRPPKFIPRSRNGAARRQVGNPPSWDPIGNFPHSHPSGIRIMHRTTTRKFATSYKAHACSHTLQFHARLFRSLSRPFPIRRKHVQKSKRLPFYEHVHMSSFRNPHLSETPNLKLKLNVPYNPFTNMHPAPLSVTCATPHIFFFPRSPTPYQSQPPKLSSRD